MDRLRPARRRRCPASPLVYAVLLLLAFGGCDGSPGSASRPDVWLVTVDPLRADRLGFTGHVGARTPHLDRLAREGAVFTDAQTPVPRTTQSIATIFTSQYPSQHGVRRLGGVLAPEAVTLAELLHEAGYSTSAVSASGVASPAEGLGQGFDVFTGAKALRRRYGVRGPGRRRREDRIAVAEAVTREARRMLESAPSPRLLWVHYTDPHFMYQPPPPFDRGVDWDNLGFYRDRLRFRPVQAATFFDRHGLSKRWLPELSALYDGEVAYVDHWIGRLLDAATRETLVLFTSDHVESLGEHGYYYDHGAYVYQASMRIPLVFRWPAEIAAGTRIGEPVSSLDILPTLLGLLGLEPPPDAVLAGVDLSARLRGTAANAANGERIHYGVSGEALLDGNPRREKGGPLWTMVRRGRWKLVRAPERAGVAFELYDVEADPHESTNLASREPGQVAALSRLLEDWRGTAEGERPPPDLSPRVEEELRALGYVE